MKNNNNNNNNNHVWKIMSKRCNILPTLACFFISSVGKFEGVRKLQIIFSSSSFILVESHVKLISIQ